MIQLHDTDVIEYNLKMSQFRSQLAQQESSKAQTDNRPKCPTCSSTKLKKVSTTSKVTNTVMWGIFGTKRHKTWHCENCGYEW